MAENRPIANQTLSVRAARNLANPTKTVPQMTAVSPRWLLHLLPWVNVAAGTYQVNRRPVLVRDKERIRVELDGDRARVEAGQLRAVSLLRNAHEPLLEVIAELMTVEQVGANQEIYREGAPTATTSAKKSCSARDSARPPRAL